MKTTIRIGNIAIDVEQSGEPPINLVSGLSENTYCVNGRVFPIPADVVELAELWNSDLSTKEMGKKLNGKGGAYYGEVVTRVSALRKALPELFPYRGANKSK